MVPGSGRCKYHPDRLGLGICVDCHSVICQECTTQFEGINRCAKCLSERHAKLRKAAARKSWTVGNVFLALVAMAAVYGLVRLLALAVEG